ncbi:RHS domain-containing protein [Ectothiorhodospiraceae bacterium 2226]|nr:RHS domain-containing protein [Ectothiorhodospiraceae bacterium 2226]
MDRLRESVAPLSEPTRYTYDRDRRLTAIELPSGQRIEHSYAQGRLARTDTPEGIVEYDYLCGGRLSQVREGLESLGYTWDGNLLTELHYQGELNESIHYAYDNQFRINQLSYAGAGSSVSYDADGLLTGIHGFSILRHPEHGLPTQVSDAALSQTRAYNAYGEPSALAYSLGTAERFAYQLERNAKGQITARTETLPDGSTRQYEYGYDARSRLSTVHRDGVLVEAYQYDANGNRSVYTSALRGRHGVSATYNLGDQLQTSGDSSYAYDANGQLAERTTAGVTTRYHYSSLGRLERVETPDKLIEYRHNAYGNRVAKLVNGEVVERYLWLDLTTLLAIYDGDGNLKQRYEYTVGHTPTRFTQDGEVYYILTDHLGSPRYITDAQGDVVKAIEYDAYGNVLHDSNPAFRLPFGFAGGLYDTDTGLIRFGYRDYDPDTGRWTARDPIGFAGGDTNLYGYVLGDPATLRDPFGLAPSWVGPTAVVVSATGGALVVAGVASGNPVVGGAGLVLVAVGGGLLFWDAATTPMEQVESIKNSESMKEIEQNLRGIQDLIDGRSRNERDGSC